MLATLIFYLRAALVFFWFLFSCVIGLVLVFARWKNPNLDAWFSRILAWGGLRLLGLRVRTEGHAKLYLHQPCVYVANHQSNIDIITMGGLYPYRTVVIGKKELKWVPLFGLFFAGAGNIMIDRGNRTNSFAGLECAKRAMLERGVSIWIFPEGTRNRGSKSLLPFKKGAFYMAIDAQVPIVPIVHQHLLNYFDHEKRRLINDREIVVRVLDPIPTIGMTPDQIPALMAEVRRKMEEALLLPELAPQSDKISRL